MSYNPNPPRAWSRVQGQCTFTNNDISYNNIFVPLLNKTLPSEEALYYDKLQYKGNILQYKANSIGLTKRQKYAQLAKGIGPSRTKVFATQTQTYSNPNTSALLRVNTVSYPFPNNMPGQPNNPAGPFQYNVPNPNGCPTTTLVDGGSLINGIYANPCTNAIIKDTNVNQQCFPTYCSDVPGKPELLCWNPKQQTFYPRQRVNMSNSLNKWPQGYKGFVSAVCGCYGLACYNVNDLIFNESSQGVLKILSGSNGTLIFRQNVLLTEVFLVGGGNAGLSGKVAGGGNNGGWGGAGGGWTKLNNIYIESGTPITLTVGTGGVYLVSFGVQSSFTYKDNTTLSLSNGDNWNASQNNSGGLNNGYNIGSNIAAQNGYQYDGIWYGGGGGYGGRNVTWLTGGIGGTGGGGGGGGFTGNNGGAGGSGTGGIGGTVGNKAGGASNNGGGGGYGDASGNGIGGNGGANGGGLGGAGGVGSGGGGGGGVNTGGGGGGGSYPANSGIPGNGGSGIIIIKYSII